MKPPRFAYAAAESVEEAVSLLAEHGRDAALLAGGQSLVPLMNMRMARPAVVIDLNRVRELDTIELGGALEIGALVRQARAERAPEIADAAPIMTEAIRQIGHPAIRSRGTIGGNVAHADASSELPTVFVALGAEMVAHGPAGVRTIPAEEFFVTHFTTALRGEMLTHIRIPRSEPGVGAAFIEVSRRQGDFALVGAAVRVRVDSAGVCSEARIVLSGVAGAPFCSVRAAEALVGRRLDDATALADVARLVRNEVSPTSDVHATSAYRKRVAGVLVRRALERVAR